MVKNVVRPNTAGLYNCLVQQTLSPSLGRRVWCTRLSVGIILLNKDHYVQLNYHFLGIHLILHPRMIKIDCAYKS